MHISQHDRDLNTACRIHQQLYGPMCQDFALHALHMDREQQRHMHAQKRRGEQSKRFALGRCHAVLRSGLGRRGLVGHSEHRQQLRLGPQKEHKHHVGGEC